MLGASFEYIGAEEMFIFELEKLILFAKEIHFAEKRFDIGNSGLMREDKKYSVEDLNADIKTASNEEDDLEYSSNPAIDKKYDVEVDTEEQSPQTASGELGEKCDQCGITTFSLYQHKRDKHGGRGHWYFCKHCDYRSYGPEVLKIHTRSLHEGVKLPCPHCGKTFAQTGSLNLHIREVHEKIKFECKECSKNFTQHYQLQIHVEKEHDSLKYPCNNCEYKATTTYSLSKHIEKHNAKDYKCGTCDYSTTKKLSFNRHTARHKTEKRYMENGPYCCPNCDYQAKNPGALQEHLKSETACLKNRYRPLKKYNCDICGKAVASLKRHMQHHTEKTFKCEQCDFESNRLGNLKNHIKCLHDETTYNCPDCPKIMKSSFNFKRHRELKHRSLAIK